MGQRIGHRKPSDQRSAIRWARRVLRSNSYVILDTETTGLGENDEIIQMAIIDARGNVLLNENVLPTKRKRIPRDATRIHGLKMDDLQGCPTFSQLRKPLKKAIRHRTIVTYNAKFDMRLYAQSFKLAGGFEPKGAWECVMLTYAMFVGDWNDYHGDYRWHKLKGGDHSALGDCFATLEVIRQMASGKKAKRWYEFWVVGE